MKLIASDEVTIHHGITGNKYLVCKMRAPLVEICNKINKSSSSIRWVKRYQAFAVRIKSSAHKKRLNGLLA